MTTISINEYKKLRGKRKAHPPESTVVTACLDWLTKQGCFVWRNNTGAHTNSYTRKDGSKGESYIRSGAVGSPDIIGISPGGAFIGVECKSHSGKVSPAQAAFGAKIRSKHGIYIVARCLDDMEQHKREILS